MTDKNRTLIAILADRSGSMASYADPPVTKATRTTNGVHDIVTEQRKLSGTTEFMLTAFDQSGAAFGTGLTTQLEKIPPGNGDEILQWSCRPRGNTPLLDALGITITEVGERLAGMPEDERPGRVIFVIATDGLENCSTEYKRDQIAEMIAHQHDAYGWDFLYVGAGFDDFDKEAASINIAAAATMSSTPVAMAAAYDSSNSAMTASRLAGTAVRYSNADRQKVADAEKSPKS
jgi:hypothetical protein